jgi:hypothetical protein
MMFLDAFAAPVPFALVWPGDGFDIALMIAALTTAAALGALALRDRQRRAPRGRPVHLVPRPRAVAVPRAAA